jgi:hypothetical protein
MRVLPVNPPAPKPSQDVPPEPVQHHPVSLNLAALADALRFASGFGPLELKK